MASRMIQKCVSEQKGGAALRTVLWAGLAALTVFFSYAVFAFAFQFYDTRNQLIFALKGADLESDQEVRKKIHAYAIRAGIKCEERDILVQRLANKVRVELPFEYRVGLPIGSQERVSIPVGMRASGERYF